MKIQEVIDKIVDFHSQLTSDFETCDTFKCGNPQNECSGIISTCAPSVEVIKQTIELGYNLIIVHEPSFYSHMDKTDWLEGKNEVFNKKLKMLNDNGIVIWRDHDYMHSHKPDLIFYGIDEMLGWRKYVDKTRRFPKVYNIPKTTVPELAEFFKEKFHLDTLRIVGSMQGEVTKVGICGHVFDQSPPEIATNLLNEVDVVIPLELIDWTVASYARDAAQMGINKTIMQIGHFSFEELGMEYAVKWIKPLVGKNIHVKFIRSGDMYKYF